MKLIRSKTSHGRKIIDFIDLCDQDCSIQESSLATDCAVWLGVNEEALKKYEAQQEAWNKIIRKLRI